MSSTGTIFSYEGPPPVATRFKCVLPIALVSGLATLAIARLVFKARLIPSGGLGFAAFTLVSSTILFPSGPRYCSLGIDNVAHSLANGHDSIQVRRGEDRALPLRLKDLSPAVKIEFLCEKGRLTASVAAAGSKIVLFTQVTMQVRADAAIDSPGTFNWTRNGSAQLIRFSDSSDLPPFGVLVTACLDKALQLNVKSLAWPIHNGFLGFDEWNVCFGISGFGDRLWDSLIQWIESHPSACLEIQLVVIPGRDGPSSVPGVAQSFQDRLKFEVLVRSGLRKIEFGRR